MAAQEVYAVIGRYSFGRRITSYELQSNTGKRQKFSRGQTILLIGQGKVTNATCQLYKDTVIIRGVDKLPTVADPSPRLEKSEKSEDAADLVTKLLKGKNTVAYEIRLKNGKIRAVARKQLLDYAHRGLINHVSLAKYQGKICLKSDGQVDLRKLPTRQIEKKDIASIKGKEPTSTEKSSSKEAAATQEPKKVEKAETSEYSKKVALELHIKNNKITFENSIGEKMRYTAHKFTPDMLVNAKIGSVYALDYEDSPFYNMQNQNKTLLDWVKEKSPNAEEAKKAIIRALARLIRVSPSPSGNDKSLLNLKTEKGNVSQGVLSFENYLMHTKSEIVKLLFYNKSVSRSEPAIVAELDEDNCNKHSVNDLFAFKFVGITDLEHKPIIINVADNMGFDNLFLVALELKINCKDDYLILQELIRKIMHNAKARISEILTLDDKMSSSKKFTEIHSALQTYNGRFADIYKAKCLVASLLKCEYKDRLIGDMGILDTLKYNESNLISFIKALVYSVRIDGTLKNGNSRIDLTDFKVVTKDGEFIFDNEGAFLKDFITSNKWNDSIYYHALRNESNANDFYIGETTDHFTYRIEGKLNDDTIVLGSFEVLNERQLEAFKKLVEMPIKNEADYNKVVAFLNKFRYDVAVKIEKLFTEVVTKDRASSNSGKLDKDKDKEETSNVDLLTKGFFED